MQIMQYMLSIHTPIFSSKVRRGCNAATAWQGKIYGRTCGSCPVSPLVWHQHAFLSRQPVHRGPLLRPPLLHPQPQPARQLQQQLRQDPPQGPRVCFG